MDTGRLPAETRQLWEALEYEPLLRGFVLIGGTALTMRIAHRLSEDLDFAYLGAKLPRQRLNVLKQRLSENGIRLDEITDVVAQSEFLDAGLELADYQQNFLAQLPCGGTVKLSFMSLDPHITKLLAGEDVSPLRVATLDEIFKSKVLVSAARSKTRDWFDLYILMNQHGFDGQDLYRVFVESSQEPLFDMASLRLRSGKPSLADEGYTALLPDPPSLETMRRFFTARLDQLEIDLSKAAFKSNKQ